MAEQLAHVCAHCDRRFASLRGLRVHQQRTHRLEYDQEIQDQRVDIKVRWSAEGVHLMASKELELEEQGVAFMNAALVPLFPARSLEAIKGKRRSAEYRRVLESLRAQQQRGAPIPQRELRPPEADNDLPIRPQNERVLRPRVKRPVLGDDGAERGLPNEAVVNVIEADDYQQVRQDVLLESDDDALERLLNKMTSLGMVVGEPRPPRGDVHNDNVDEAVLPRAARKRRQYAKQQSLYARDKAEALKFIVDKQNYVDRTTPSKEIRCEWQEYFQVNPGLRRVQDAESMVDNQDIELFEGLDARITPNELEMAMKSTNPSTARGLDGISLADLQAMSREDVLEVVNGIFSLAPQFIFRGRITLIPKKNRPTLFGDFRPICVMPLIVRILHRVLAARLSVVRNNRFQAGFTAGKSTSENIWLLKGVLSSAGPRKSSTYLALLDCQKAFDSVAQSPTPH
ncbi:UNVERIFIED_CONTAM: hypothetical protein RMT77_002533 [Armadillidium vulgare]